VGVELWIAWAETMRDDLVVWRERQEFGGVSLK
jgi:hypothetical protein